MPLWTDAKPPIWKVLSAGKYSTRKVIATDAGWVHRSTYIDQYGNKRTKDEILVSIPRLGGAAKGHAFPTVREVYTANTSGGTALKRNKLNHLYLVFSEPIGLANSAAPLRVTIANTAGGNTVIATSNNQTAAITNGDNTVHFKFKVATGGTYKVQTQTVANSASWNLLSGHVSETLWTFSSALTGTLSQNTSSNTVTGSSTLFSTQLVPGDWVKYSTGKEYRVHSIGSATSMVVIGRPTAPVTANTFTKRVTTAANTVVGVGTKFDTELSVGSSVKLTATSEVLRVHSIASPTSMVVTPRPAANVASDTFSIKRSSQVYSLNAGGEYANLVISSAVSNALSTFVIV